MGKYGESLTLECNFMNSTSCVSTWLTIQYGLNQDNMKILKNFEIYNINLCSSNTLDVHKKWYTTHTAAFLHTKISQ